LYTQVGYLLPDATCKKGQIMPYASFAFGNYKRLGGLQVDIYNTGINYLIKGHNAKVSLDWQNRPTFELDGSGAVQKGTRKNSIILQYQIFI
jgi:hypothetical protein